MLIDAEQRTEALNPSNSYIVQAPAGSGKTELLTLRFLTLLTTVKKPEEIIALTFTRKAAAEMKSRILANLENPSQDEPKNQLIQVILKKDQELKWNLLQNPNRLKIQTIDSLCSNIVKNMPILAKLGSQPNVSDDPESLYRQAATALLTHIVHDNDSLIKQAFFKLMLHLDNDYNKLINLMITMLSCRDQWSNYLIKQEEISSLKIMLEKNLLQTNTDHFLALKNFFPHYLWHELLEIVKFANEQLHTETNSSYLQPAYNFFINENSTKNASNEKCAWLSLADFLLTKDGYLRKRFTKNEGFPATSSSKNPQEKQLFSSMKDRVTEFTASLENNNAFIENLHTARILPPDHYNEKQWNILSSLLQLLPYLIAELQLIFQKYNQVDYIEIAAQALNALGTEHEPTDITLALDNQIQHLLIDEFQDTSINQFKLIQQLIAGWSNQDGRTLFLVGDPMQSIYRFRKAEVGLFLTAEKHGIGNINLTPLKLSTNFRSRPEIIDWINDTFKILMPNSANLSHGAIPYSPSHANTHESHGSSKVHIHAQVENESNCISNIIRDSLNENPQGKIAILVRARSHLKDILSHLQEHQIPCQAVEIQSLADQAIIRDLLGLTRALLHPADRTAWLAMLRAPWAGLSLSDLHHICAKDKTATLWELLSSCNLTHLSTDGRLIVSRIVIVLNQRLTLHGLQALPEWIEGTWLALGGPACINDPNELEYAKLFFNLIRKFQHHDEITQPQFIESKLQKLYPKLQQQNSQIEAMTIHKAKGLEFDTVIVPGLERMLTTDDAKLLLYQEKPRENGSIHLLLAPIKASEDDSDDIYSFLRTEEQKYLANENIRLLYVAATRAKTHLHLIGHIEQNKSIFAPAKNSLLAILWPQIAKYFMQNPSPELTTIQNFTAKKPQLKRLKPSWQIPAIINENIYKNSDIIEQEEKLQEQIELVL